MRSSRGATWCLALSLIGIGVCAYLFFLHLGLQRGELLGGPVCSGSGAFNCHAVTGGSWGAFLGMPLSVWGLVGYLTVFALSLLARQSPEWSGHALTVIVWLAAVFVALDLVLLAVMVAVIRAYCVFCLVTYLVNLALLVVSARSLPQPRSQAIRQLGPAVAALRPSGQRPATLLFWGLLLAGLSGSVALHAATTFVSQGTIGGMRKQIREFLLKQPRVSVRVEGDPAIGGANAPRQIVEFSDFFCPSCQRASKMNAIILANHRRDTRFVFKHFPLDTACNTSINRMVHSGACRVAAASECAHLQGTFWPFHDRVFEKGPAYKVKDLDHDVRELGLDPTRFEACMASGQGMEAVKQDIAEAARLGIASTPTYLINGVPVAGGMTPAVFDQIVAELREHAR